MDRLWVRGKGNVRKKVLIQAAACNLALLMRSLYGSGKPKAAHDRIQAAILATLMLLATVNCVPESAARPRRASDPRGFARTHYRRSRCWTRSKIAGLDTGC
jgi:hypothetical protein